MSAVDLPPGLLLSGFGAAEFGAPQRKQILAKRVLWLVLVCGSATSILAARHPHRDNAHVLFLAPLFILSVAVLGWLVRSARIRVDDGGVHWGWNWGWSQLGFRMDRKRIRWIRIYTNAIALKPRRGSIWYLAARDWDGYERLADVFAATPLPVVQLSKPAPWWARLQSYGAVLDGLLILDAAIALIALAAAWLG